IHDPYKELYDKELNVFQLVHGKYQPYDMDINCYMPELTLGLVMWEGLFENASAPFIRWCDREGSILRTGAEGIAEEAKRADEEAKRADEEAKRADEAVEEAKAEAEAKLAEAKRADEEAKRADEEAKRADEAEAKVQALLKRLADMGLTPLD
ncbi:MAG: hypothetical protein EAY75_04875, partial [Bacteroidetes bacterium]